MPEAKNAKLLIKRLALSNVKSIENDQSEPEISTIDKKRFDLPPLGALKTIMPAPELIIVLINNNIFTIDSCIPLFLVPEVGIEPTRSRGSQHFECCASTSFATRAQLHFNLKEL